MSKLTNKVCSICGSPMEVASGIGQSEIQYDCSNPECPSHYPNEKCPECGSKKFRIEVHGLGDQLFICLNCGNQW